MSLKVTKEEKKRITQGCIKQNKKFGFPKAAKKKSSKKR